MNSIKTLDKYIIATDLATGNDFSVEQIYVRDKFGNIHVVSKDYFLDSATKVTALTIFNKNN